MSSLWLVCLLFSAGTSPTTVYFEPYTNINGTEVDGLHNWTTNPRIESISDNGNNMFASLVVIGNVVLVRTLRDAFTHAHTRMHTCAHAGTHENTRTPPHMHVHTQIIHTYIHTYIHTQTHTYIHTYYLYMYFTLYIYYVLCTIFDWENKSRIDDKNYKSAPLGVVLSRLAT